MGTADLRSWAARPPPECDARATAAHALCGAPESSGVPRTSSGTPSAPVTAANVRQSSLRTDRTCGISYEKSRLAQSLKIPVSAVQFRLWAPSFPKTVSLLLLGPCESRWAPGAQQRAAERVSSTPQGRARPPCRGGCSWSFGRARRPQTRSIVATPRRSAFARAARVPSCPRASRPRVRRPRFA